MNKLGFMEPNFFKVTHSYPSSIISCIHNAPPHGAAEVSRITSLVNESTTSTRVLKDVHLSTQLLDGFLDLAEDNTSKDLETCGVLGAFLKEGTYYVTTLIIPKQDSTSSTCQAFNEEEIFAIQNEQSLFPVGWIHTHPSQSCFMSSVDLHTQYSYQVMVPEAVAIVMAPTDTSRSYGYFRLSDPDGMKIVRECQETGFHTHSEPLNGASIYEDCSNIYLNPNLRLEIFDLRH
ncbi:AMSH-like ubiquitin thioesterase 2 isoform X1 [Lactuca sativa]|uniref:AMSH-like ubiquitin thioesterase 2 isoform X1 n=1 Tax=Lactuca sativa TaxID=4236 RepID=UPI000CD9BC35|nr:AMSH-like ubiquitin thioesterase 2 isoform X1 [Lactuca sativa]XP_042756758.1 AMSH-like ubiquitin thioesterase 2 isoform X1 [Lactuca sativa]